MRSSFFPHRFVSLHFIASLNSEQQQHWILLRSEQIIASLFPLLIHWADTTHLPRWWISDRMINWREQSRRCYFVTVRFNTFASTHIHSNKPSSFHVEVVPQLSLVANERDPWSCKPKAAICWQTDALPFNHIQFAWYVQWKTQLQTASRIFSLAEICEMCFLNISNCPTNHVLIKHIRFGKLMVIIFAHSLFIRWTLIGTNHLSTYNRSVLTVTGLIS